jgi:hypothetical protein
LSHDEKFSLYELVMNPEEGIEEPPPVHFGDLREPLGGEYAVNILRRPDGGAVLGIGAHRYASTHLRKLYANHSKPIKFQSHPVEKWPTMVIHSQIEGCLARGSWI